MASFTAPKIDKVFSPISGSGGGTCPMLETPSGGMVNAQGTADGEMLVSIKASELASLATQATQAQVLAKLSADPATQTTLAALLALAGTPGTPSAITPHDDTDTSTITAKGIIVGGAGDLIVRGVDAPLVSVTIPVQAGQYVGCHCSRVMAATTATGLVGLS